MNNDLVRQPIKPAHLWVPEGSTFFAGQDAADLAEQLGFDVAQEERDVLGALLAQDENGQCASLEAAIVCGRQNIKTWSLEMSVLHDLFVADVARITWSAHLFKTTQSTFQNFDRIIGDTPWLNSKVRTVHRSNGEEGFTFKNGAQLDFLARSNKSGRGLTGDRVILDEALFLSEAQLGALMPTLSSRPDPQVRYGSSPGVLESRVLRKLRNRGREGGDPSLSYIEYSSEREPCLDAMCRHMPGTEGCVLDDESKWREANPALGRRISIDYVRSERRALSPSEFMRERLGWWQDPIDQDSNAIIPMESWLKRFDEKSVTGIGHRVAFAIDTSWDRQTTWIAICGAKADGTPHVEIVAFNYGTEWVIPWLQERVPTWNPVGIALQGTGSPVSSLVEGLEAAFGDLVLPQNGSDLGKACGFLFDSVTNGPLAHFNQPQLNEAVLHAAIRAIGDSWVWDRKKSPVDIAPLVAITQALWIWSSNASGPSIYETKDLLVL